MSITTITDDPAWVDNYIMALRETGLERTAAARAGTTVRKVNRLREVSTEFDLACKDAEEQAADALELEARRRAVDGVEKGVYYQGELVDHEIQYSDTLLAMLLKGRREHVFGDKRKITGANGEPLTIRVTTFAVPNQREPIDGEAVRLPLATQLADAITGEEDVSDLV